MQLKIGFMDGPFPLVDGSEFDSETFELYCRRYRVNVTVSQCKLKLGEFEFTGVITSRVSIAENLPLGGFGSHSYVEESETMLEAVNLYASKRNSVIGQTFNNWPFYRGFLHPDYAKHNSNEDIEDPQQ